MVTASADTFYVLNITCPENWVKALNNCYYFNNKDYVAWQEARTQCKIMNADLLFVKNSQEQNWINSQTTAYKTEGWWVGLEYTKARIWDWMQAGGDRSSINWRNEPDNFQNNQDCYAINEFGLFSDEFCDTKLGFICKYSINRGEYCVSTTGNWLMTDTACLFISPLINTTLQLTWKAANAYCSNLVPDRVPQLLSVVSQDEMQTIQSLLRTYDASRVILPWWSGMTKARGGRLIWQNGSDVNTSLIQWDKAPDRDRFKQRNCGVMFQGGVISDKTCDKRAHYICEQSAFSGYFNFGCGPWLRAGSSCYIVSKDKRYTWPEASRMCSKANGHLIKIDDVDELFWLKTLEFGGRLFWTGLNTRAGPDSWQWTDGSSPNQSLIPWGQEPNNYEGNENCASIYRLGVYNDLNCDAQLGYICEYTVDPGVNCTPGWEMRGMSSCYMIVPYNGSGVTWDEAKDRCNDLVSSFGLVAYRLAVNDKDEQAWINAKLLQQPPASPWFWTGLNDRKMEGIWQYDEEFNNPPDIDVIPWAKEPNNISGNDDCAVVYDGGFFNDIDCETKVNFICERPVHHKQKDSAAICTKHVNILQTALIIILSFVFAR